MSNPFPNMPVIDDNNYLDVVDNVVINGDKKQFGLNRRRLPYGALPYSATPPAEYLLPWDKIKDGIKRLTETESSLVHVWHKQGYVSLDQNGTNYCWMFGMVSAMQASRAAAGYEYIPLSPAYGACQIKNFRNEGGWGDESLKWCVEEGVCSQKEWPQAAIDRRYLTEAARAEAKKNRITSYWDVPSSLQWTLSLVVQGIPCPVAFDWWSHLVCAMFGTYYGANDYGLIILNSWSTSYGDRGFGELRGSRANPDDVQAVIGTTPR